MKLRTVIENLIDFARYGHPFARIALLVGPFIVSFAFFGALTYIPLSSTSSRQAGLTLLGEILGVTLGAILVIIVFLAEQVRSCSSMFSRAFPRYLELATSNRRSIASGRKQLVKLVKRGDFDLTDSTSEYTEKSFKETIGALSALSAAVSAEDFEKLETELLEIGFTKDEVMDIVSVKGTTAHLFPDDSLKLLEEALDPLCIYEHCSGKIHDLTEEVFEGYYQTGISDALERHKTFRSFLRNPLLALAIAITSGSLVISVVTLFGVTDQTASDLMVVAPMYLSLVGFIVSLVLTGFAIRHMFTATL